jgi:hypothetical protein
MHQDAVGVMPNALVDDAVDGSNENAMPHRGPGTKEKSA